MTCDHPIEKRVTILCQPIRNDNIAVFHCDVYAAVLILIGSFSIFSSVCVCFDHMTKCVTLTELRFLKHLIGIWGRCGWSARKKNILGKILKLIIEIYQSKLLKMNRWRFGNDYNISLKQFLFFIKI